MRGISSSHILLLISLHVLGAATRAAGPENVSAIPSANSRFEGIIDMRLTLESGNGDLELSLSGDMAKLDMQLTIAPLPEPIRLCVLMDAKTPKTAYLVSDRTKTYSSINLTNADNPSAAEEKKGKYKAKVLGQEKILEFVCTHVTLTRDKDLIDAWITKDMPDVYAVLKKLQEANPQIGEAALFRALEATGNAGVPMRCIVVHDGQRVTTEVKKVERRALPPALFAIPKDYVRNQVGSAGLQPTPAQIEEMKKILQGALEKK